MNYKITEIVFLIEEDPEGGYTAKALGESIFTEADDMVTLKEMVRDGVRCHFPSEVNRPKLIRLHFVRDELDLVFQPTSALTSKF